MVFFKALHENNINKRFARLKLQDLPLLLKEVEKHVFSPKNGWTTCYL